MARPRTATTTNNSSSDEGAESILSKTADGAELARRAAADNAEREVAMVASDEARTEALLRSVNERTWFDEQVELARKAGKPVLVERSSQMWAWKNGPARFRAIGLKRLYWLDPSDGKEKSSVLVLATVMDANTRAGKDYVTKTVLVGMPYTIARVIAVACGATVDREHPPSAFFEAVEKSGDHSIVVNRASNFVAYVECGTDGLPVYENIRGGRRMVRDAGCAVL